MRPAVAALTLFLLACSDGRPTTPEARASSVPGGVVADAQGGGPATMQGNWTFAVTTALGTIPISCTFKHQNNGSCNMGGALPMSYRETAIAVSASFEVPDALSPDGFGLTVTLRLTKQTNNTVAGTAVMMSDVMDLSTARFLTSYNNVTGQRQ